MDCYSLPRWAKVFVPALAGLSAVDGLGDREKLLQLQGTADLTDSCRRGRRQFQLVGISFVGASCAGRVQLNAGR